MKHYDEEDLTLYFYGEGPNLAAIEAHVAACPSCAARYRDIGATLALLTAPEPPERGDQYGLEVWQRIRHTLRDRRARFFGSWWIAAAAAAAVIVVAFGAGERWQQSVDAPRVAASPVSQDTARRILLTSVADHLDRSERLLTDILNRSDTATIADTHVWADDLLTTNRLYRRDAVRAGEQSVADVLDDLERALMEIVHSPSTVTDDDLDQMRHRIDAASLLFKVRVLGDELRRHNQTS
jgi:hypothetical protein